jgi:flavin reductase (DIM6/NTAB) family NADH-FMN oxidoreductase RutF
MTITRAAILQMDQRKRAQLINALSGIKSANLIGTKDNDGKENLCIVSSVFHLGSNPALLGFIQRPTSVERHTFRNIESTGLYTINAIGEHFCDKAHQTSARYEKEVSEFEATGLTPVYKGDFFAPYVGESELQIGMQLEQIIPIEINGTKLMIGSIQEVHTEINIQDDGYLELAENKIVGITGLDTYIKSEKINRYSYAKPNEELKTL